MTLFAFRSRCCLVGAAAVGLGLGSCVDNTLSGKPEDPVEPVYGANTACFEMTDARGVIRTENPFYGWSEYCWYITDTSFLGSGTPRAIWGNATQVRIFGDAGTVPNTYLTRVEECTRHNGGYCGMTGDSYMNGRLPLNDSDGTWQAEALFTPDYDAYLATEYPLNSCYNSDPSLNTCYDYPPDDMGFAGIEALSVNIRDITLAEDFVDQTAMNDHCAIYLPIRVCYDFEPGTAVYQPEGDTGGSGDGDTGGPGEEADARRSRPRPAVPTPLELIARARAGLGAILGVPETKSPPRFEGFAAPGGREFASARRLERQPSAASRGSRAKAGMEPGREPGPALTGATFSRALPRDGSCEAGSGRFYLFPTSWVAGRTRAFVPVQLDGTGSLVASAWVTSISPWLEYGSGAEVVAQGYGGQGHAVVRRFKVPWGGRSFDMGELGGEFQIVISDPVPNSAGAYYVRIEWACDDREGSFASGRHQTPGGGGSVVFSLADAGCYFDVRQRFGARLVRGPRGVGGDAGVALIRLYGMASSFFRVPLAQAGSGLEFRGAEGGVEFFGALAPSAQGVDFASVAITRGGGPLCLAARGSLPWDRPLHQAPLATPPSPGNVE